MSVNESLIVIRLGNISFKDGLHLPDKSPVKIIISGHSGNDSRGRDIVCAAVSALSQTLVLSINRLVKVEQSVKVQDGILSSTLQPAPEQAEENKLKLLIESFLIGILEIQREYPDRIKIENDVC
ncbi:MAG: ribosomal-processing cysteine protease Prp [Spirochaetes bacterium]|nr:ribosomal-processing cysteine protease Prp [Spirochaetota bacterium]